ncbi:AAA family ATPase [Larkinella sp.]|uniref:AAA family ATPase n=1 Tax=Larkinella sp. TaxID=2034517 RepID=UPI003BAA93F6
MEKQHLTYFKIENFKRFDSFEMSNLGQFNLIVGDNNVGKTSVLEALTFDENAKKMVYNYILCAIFRENGVFGIDDKDETRAKKIEFWKLIFKNSEDPIKIYINNEQYQFEVKLKENLTIDEKKYIQDNLILTSVNGLIIVLKSKTNKYQFVSINNFFIDVGSYCAFIPANIGIETDMVGFFYNYFNNNKENRKKLESIIRNYIPNLEEIRVHRISEDKELIGFTLTDRNDIRYITQYGEGTVRMARIIMEIIISQNQRLMIDEVSNGIHFSGLKQYWKTIVNLCKQCNVQLFATTHSLECQQAFIEALQDNDMQQFQADARNILMAEDKNGIVQSYTYTFEEFEFSIANNINTRGGRR